MVDQDTEFQCLITLDRVLFAGRRKIGLSQRELAEELSGRTHQIDYILYSKIENARIDIRFAEWNWLIPKLARWLQIDQRWLESIRQQTNVKPFTSDTPAFVTYARRIRG